MPAPWGSCAWVGHSSGRQPDPWASLGETASCTQVEAVLLPLLGTSSASAYLDHSCGKDRDRGGVRDDTGTNDTDTSYIDVHTYVFPVDSEVLEGRDDVLFNFVTLRPAQCLDHSWGSEMPRHGSIPGSESSPGGGHGNPLQCFCLESPWTEEPGGLLSIRSQSWARLK